MMTDLLIVLGVAAAYSIRRFRSIRGSGHVYFEVGCLVLVMVTLGRWLESSGKLKTTEALDALEKLLPEHVRVIGSDDHENIVPLARTASRAIACASWPANASRPMGG